MLFQSAIRALVHRINGYIPITIFNYVYGHIIVLHLNSPFLHDLIIDVGEGMACQLHTERMHEYPYGCYYPTV